MRNNLFKIFIAFLLLIAFTIPNITTIVDCSSVALGGCCGNIITVDDDGYGDYTKIQDAIGSALEGDIIEVFSGTYQESITVNKRLTLLGIKENEEGEPVINAGGDEFAVTFTADNCVFEGFKVMNTSKGMEDLGCAGIKILSDNNLLKNNTIVDNYDGMWLENSDGNILDNNNISFNKIGMFLLESCNNTVTSNLFSNKYLAIQMWYHSDNNTFSNNKINGNGIQLMESSNNEISNNTIAGYSESFIGIGLQELCYTNNIIGNIISNMKIGLGISYSDSNIIAQNNISNNSMFGIQLLQSNKNTIKCNNFIKNGLSDSPLKRMIFGQAFFMQSFRNCWDKNYWDDWQHSLIPRPIKGKLGKNAFISWRNYDWHPAKRPYEI